ncbi:binding partner of ACD11 1 isoform X2 [Prosopis cineraria]|uniref:binding partner of ACD11 1 isoform X2 n=1 Tax=Prosopis cineraria TaxID=364024 RepID=UPI00240EEACD|nr:binding partner of ACD11 1 isoform X2 [Prosopis cineraria]
MNCCGYTAEVTKLSPRATEKDVHNFFTYSGVIEHIEVFRSDEDVNTAYVTFRDAYALETALLLNDIHMQKFASTPGEAVTLAQEVVKTMVAKGYVLGKDALIKAKEFDESYRLSSRAAARVAELSKKIGLTDTINSSMETFKSVDEKYHVTDITKSATTFTGTAAIALATVTGRAAVAAGNAVVNSSYFAKGALWVSDMLDHAAKSAADLSQRNK